eukprot:4218303-Pyramimonas_sp.AAC.1
MDAVARIAGATMRAFSRTETSEQVSWCMDCAGGLRRKLDEGASRTWMGARRTIAGASVDIVRAAPGPWRIPDAGVY